MSTCERCNGSGFEDSGGVQSWGEPILVECECRLMERDMDESRKAFEQWFPEMVEGIPPGMVEVFDKMLFMAWQASRAAIELDMPEPFKLAKSSSGLTYYYQDEVDAVLSCAGIKVKE